MQPVQVSNCLPSQEVLPEGPESQRDQRGRRISTLNHLVFTTQTSRQSDMELLSQTKPMQNKNVSQVGKWLIPKKNNPRPTAVSFRSLKEACCVRFTENKDYFFVNEKLLLLFYHYYYFTITFIAIFLMTMRCCLIKPNLPFFRVRLLWGGEGWGGYF